MANTAPVGAGTVINKEKHKINVINKEKHIYLFNLVFVKIISSTLLCIIRGSFQPISWLSTDNLR